MLPAASQDPIENFGKTHDALCDTCSGVEEEARPTKTEHLFLIEDSHALPKGAGFSRFFSLLGYEQVSDAATIDLPAAWR